jgi:ubiquinone/menaquinone biosynthesis C-methylase UbiE
MEITTVDEVLALSYTDLLSVIGETNRCPGGLSTVRRIAKDAFLSRDSKVLEIGSNTGFTSIELARATYCHVTGIDISTSSVNVARANLAGEARDVADVIAFEVGSAYDVPFADASFDAVVAGGSFSFMDAKQRALEEAVRVLRPFGYFSATNLCYLTPSPPEILASVSRIIGTEIRDFGPGDWVDFYDGHPLLERVEQLVSPLSARSVEVIHSHVDYFRQHGGLDCYATDVQTAILKRWEETIIVFNENHRNLAFVYLIYRKNATKSDPDLFSVDAASAFARRHRI